MYRAPEMLDLYQNFPINQQSDMWVSNRNRSIFYDVWSFIAVCKDSFVMMSSNLTKTRSFLVTLNPRQKFVDTVVMTSENNNHDVIV